MSGMGARHLQTLQQRRRSRRTKRFDHGAPIAKIDLRPAVLFFWLLPVLVVFTAPATTHAVVVDLANTPFFQRFDPSEAERQQAYRESFGVTPVTNELRITDEDIVLWNGERITQGQLITLLHESITIAPEPRLVFEPDPLASYDLAAQVIATVKRMGIVKFEFGGLEQHCWFTNGDYSQRATSLQISLSLAAPDPHSIPLPEFDEICPAAPTS